MGKLIFLLMLGEHAYNCIYYSFHPRRLNRAKLKLNGFTIEFKKFLLEMPGLNIPLEKLFIRF